MNQNHLEMPSREDRTERETDPDRGADLPASRAHMLAQSLGCLLQRYVDLVDSSAHGGWSLADEEAVRAVTAALEEAGWPARTMQR